MNIIADTCFWIALYDTRDSHHTWAKETWDKLQYGNKFLIPYPTMYEFIDTRFEKDKENLEFFKRLFNNETLVQRISDEEYKDDALQLSLQWTKRTISLVDHTIRLMLDDDKIKKHALITLNVKDFVDVCRTKNIRMIYCEK